MKKYVTLKCSVCARSKNDLIDVTHYTPDKCTITMGCDGRLAQTGLTSQNKIIGAAPVGMTNWLARGSSISDSVSVTEEILVNLSTGSKTQFVLAVQGSFSETATAGLTFTVQTQTSKDFRQYTYRRTGSVSVINGVEDGTGKKVLRYSITGSNPDLVEVYVNGVKQTYNVDFELYDGTGTSAVPPNSVLFTNVLTSSSTQVDIVISKYNSSSEIVLPFSRAIDDESRAQIGAWEGIQEVSTPVLGSRTLFYMDFSEFQNIPIDTKLTAPVLVITDGTTNTIPNSNASFLFSRSVVSTQLDRQRTMMLSLSALENSYLVSKIVQSTRTLLAPESQLSTVFPAFIMKRFNTRTLQKSNLTGDSDSVELDNQLVIGPDV